MIQEALKYLTGLGKTEANLGKATYSDELSSEYQHVLINETGGVTRIDLFDSEYLASTFDAFVFAVAQADKTAVVSKHPYIAVTEKQIIYTTDSTGKKGDDPVGVTLDLQFDSRWVWLCDQSAIWTPQAKMQQLIEERIFGCFPESFTQFLETFSARSEQSRSSESRRGVEKGMQEFTAEVSNVEKYPPFVDVTIPIYLNDGFALETSVSVKFDVKPDGQMRYTLFEHVRRDAETKTFKLFVEQLQTVLKVPVIIC